VAVATPRGHPTVACAHVFSVFGPGEDPGRALPSIIRSLLDGRPVDVGAGTQLRDYVHVEDVAAGLVTVLESGTTGGVDVCLGRARPLREVFEEVGRATGAPDLVHFGARADRPHELFDAVGSPATLRALGWRPARSFAERIDETVAWWRSHSDARFAVGSTR
jgi:nucleoside-diphosphate-sugar epimerase